MKKLLLLTLLTACQTASQNEPTQSEPTRSTVQSSALEEKVRTLEFMINFEMYDRAIENCFTQLYFCRLQVNDPKSGACWDKHETCVISTTERWKDLKRRNGYK